MSERVKHKLAGYVSKSCGQLLPYHIHKNRKCPVSINSTIDFQTMATMMVERSLFFHFDDLDGLTVEYLIPEQFVFDLSGNIMSMCQKVFGKSDKN